MKVVPVLSADNLTAWIHSPLAKGRALLANYFVTDRWQSHSYQDTIYSIVDILLEQPEEEALMVMAVKTALSNYFSLHFTNVEVDTSIKIVNEERVLSLSISWTVDDVTYSISEYRRNLDALQFIILESNTGHPLGQ